MTMTMTMMVRQTRRGWLNINVTPHPSNESNVTLSQCALVV
jgi:hypothetical protein